MKTKTWMRAWWLVLLIGLLLVSANAADTLEDTPPEAYAALFAGELENNTVEAAAQQETTLLEGKSILCIGDSIMAGYRLPDPQQSWVSMLESCYGMKVTNCSISGSTIASADQTGYMVGGCYEPMVERELPDGSYDLILVEGSGNDWYCAIPLGDSTTDRDPKTFQGAINVIIDRLQEKYPRAVILFMTPWIPKYRAPSEYTPEQDYQEAMTQVCAARGIPCYQARNPEISGIHTDDVEFRRQYCLTETDAWHLNPAGQALFLPHIAQWLEEQTKEKVLIAGFRDVKRQDWYADTVEYMVGSGLMMGTENDTFSPEEAMTRGMLIAVLYRAAGYPDVAEGEMPFADVRPGTYYYDAVRWGYQQGVIYGVDETHFNPDQNLTREQMTSILYRWWNSAHSDAEKDENPEILEAFSDEGKISGYARPGMAWAVEHGIVYGTGGDQLEPQSNATRSQVAAMLLRYWTGSNPEEPDTSDTAGEDGTIDE